MSGRRLLVALSSALLGLGVGLLPGTPATAAPAAPSLLSPNGTAISSNTPTFSWTRVAGASRYEVWVDDDENFGSPVSAVTSNRRWVPNAPLANGHEYWRVRAVGADNSSSPWSTAAFVINQQAGPTIVSPANGDVLQQPGNPPLLSWTAVNGATGYTVEVDDDPFFLDKRTYTTKTTSIVVPDQAHDGTYHWHVRANFAAGISSLDSPDSTYVIGPLAQVTNANPDAVDVPHEDVVLDWDPVPGASAYNLWVSTDPDFNNTQATVLPNTTRVYGTRYSPPTTFLNNQYYWKVRAINADNETIDWNAVERHIFRRDWTDKPALVFPEDRLAPSHADPFYFQWTPVDHATYYELNVGTDPNFTTGTFNTCTTASTTYTSGYSQNPGDSCMPSQGVTYYWRVRAIDSPAGVQGIYSPIRRFVYDSGQVTQLSPANGATVAVPTLRWAPSPEAQTYRVEVTDKNGALAASADTYSLSWTPNNKLDPTKSPFSWTVQARDANTKLSPKYWGWSFTIAGDPPTTGAAPLTPLTGIAGDSPTSRFPSLTWEPHAEAAHYRIRIGVHGSGFWDVGVDSILTETFAYPAATSKDDGYLTPGSYDWQIVAYSATNAFLGGGTVGTFTIADLPDVTGQRIALTGSSLDNGSACTAALDDPMGSGQCDDVPATPVLDWDPVPGAALYKVYVAQDPNLTNLVYGSSSATVPRTVNTRWTPTMANAPAQLPDSQAGKAYYWYVLPCKSQLVCNADPVSVVNIATNAFSKRSPQPVLQSPAQGSTQANDLAFSWQDYLVSNQASTWAPSGEVSHQTARQYRLQVSTKNDFSVNVETVVVDQTTHTPVSTTYPEGTLYWRVQAVDAANNGLSWSPTGSLVKHSPVPELVSPRNDVHTGGMSAFRWRPTPFAGSYRLEVYRNNDVTFSAANRMIATTTKQTAYAYGLPLPASSQPYLWRVQRLDGTNKPGSFSAVGRFYSTGTAPAQVAPANGARVVANDGYFAWTAVPGAARYQFEYRPATATNGTRVSTSALAYAPPSPFTDGSWQWRVHALDANNAPIGTSPWRSFSVDGTAPTVIAIKPAHGALVGPRVNFSATFSEPVTNVTKRTVRLYKKGSSTPVYARVTLSSNKRVMVLNPNRKLSRGKIYTLKISSAVRDLHGLRLVRKSWKVTVKR